jgi:hypothetical protein
MTKARISQAFVVPGERIELPTNGLQNRCSTAELTRLFNDLDATDPPRGATLEQHFISLSPRQPPLPALGAHAEVVRGGKQRALRNLGGLCGRLDQLAALAAVGELLAQ